MANHVWIIEMLYEGSWKSTVGAYITKSEAVRYKKEDWEDLHPDIKFRIRKYVAQQ